ncbi:MAG TPA: retroviral-like aspartic protease family protein [Coleofasciculaceae cyanobacterium]
MWKQRWASLIGLGAIALTGCEALPFGAAPKPSPTAEQAIATPAAPVAAQPQKPSAPPKPSVDGAATFQKALDLAYGAAKLTQSAQIPADWQYVMSRWQDAIGLLKTVPSQSGEYAKAQVKIQEYQRNLAYATLRSTASATAAPSTVAMQPLSSAPISAPTSDGTSQGAATVPAPGIARDGTTADPSAGNDTASADNSPDRAGSPAGSGSIAGTAPIVGRVSGIPVIEVLFDGRKFPMMLDTGASATVITPSMMSALGLQPRGKINVTTPSDRKAEMAITRVGNVQVGGITASDLDVAVAPSLEIGLLGQNFFGGYDIIIRSNQIEFHNR